MTKHQIITVGKDLDTIYLGIKEFRPEAIHLLATAETRGLYGDMLRLISPKIRVFEYLVGPYDVEGIMRVCGEIQEAHPGDEFIYNLSEGTKIMAMAAGKVAMEFGARGVYITQDGYWIDTFDYRRRRLTEGISNSEYMKLYGNNVREFEDVGKMKELDINTAWYAKKFIENHYEVYSVAKKWYRSLSDKARAGRSTGRLGKGYVIETDGGTLSVYRGSEVLFDSACRRSCEIMFIGRWWEIVVADTVSKWKKEGGGIWRDVIFNDIESNAAKNEIDLVVNDRQRLLLIECKSGEVFSADIFKIDSVRKTYGGGNSKAILASYLPLSRSLEEKCRDLGIYAFAPADLRSRKDHIRDLPRYLDEVLTLHEF